MSKQNYGWKRFWCPRSGNINLADGGYLCDPDAGFGKVYSPDLVNLETVTNVPCLVLLGEPGIGKSQELDNLKALTEKAVCDPSRILSLNLRSCTDLQRDLFRNKTFTDWLGNSYQLYLFLDSLDEGLLSVPTLAAGLLDELKKPEYQNHISRLHLRLACRTFVFPALLEEGLRELWQEANFAIYELAPLRRRDVAEAANAEGVSSEDFMNELGLKDVVPLAIKPITLKFLLNTYRRHNSQFPPEQKLHELYLEGCKLLCEEVNKSRQASGRVGILDNDQRLIIAARIAAITIFTNHFAVWTSVDQGNVPTEDIHLQRLCVGCEKINGRELEVTREAVKEVLDTGLFSSRGLHRIGWAHQTYAEFLAAWYLTKHETPIEQIKRLITANGDLDHKLIPQLHETAAWLASMRIDVLQEIVKTDPDVILQADVPTDAGVRASIVENLLTQYEEGKLYDRGRNNYRNYVKLKHPRLVEQLRPYICDSNKQIDARDLAIDIAEVCEVSELQNELLNLALDSSQQIYLRASAAKAICSVGDATARIKLKPLAIQQLPEDENDQLKGYALMALWPDYLNAEDLFMALTRPKKRNFTGSYRIFIDYVLTSRLRPDDLLIALNWLAMQGIRCSGHPFEELGDAIVFKAWENFDLPGVAESFTQVAIVQWREHQNIITHNSEIEGQFSSLLLRDTDKRHILVDQAVQITSNSEEKPDFLISSLMEDILASEDIFWMLEKLQNCTCKKTQEIWARLIECCFNRQDAGQISAIISAAQTNNILQSIFEPYFMPVDLNSHQAEQMIAYYLRWEENQERRKKTTVLDPPPRERVLQLLGELEAGDLSTWWQLNAEMTFNPESQSYGDELQLDLTQLPGWKEAEEATRSRLIEAAKQYIQYQNDVDYDWIGTNSVDLPALAGCRALYLLLIICSDFIDGLPSETWQRWTPIIVATPSSNQREDSYLELVKYAYLNAPSEFIEILIMLIDRDNQKYNYLSGLHRLDKCWDERLKLALLEKAKDRLLKTQCIGQLLDELLKQGLVEATDFAKSLITFPLPSINDEREKALIAARALVENSDPSSWSFVWALIQQDSLFGREVFEFIASRRSFGIQLNLTEVQLADLYIWLVHQYPFYEDPDHSNGEAYSPTARDGIVGLRDGVLSQLVERGTLEALSEIQRLIQEFPDITWLGKTLIDAQANMRRKTWQPPTPEEFLQFVISQEPSNLDLSNQINVIDGRTKKMENEPKTETNINISNSSINAPFGTSGVTNSNVTISSPDVKKGINWGNWLAVIGILVAIVAIPLSMSVSGAFNEEFKEWFNSIFSPKVEQQSVPKSE